MLIQNGSATLVAPMLGGAWRVTPPQGAPISLREFDQVMPLLYDSGAAGLGWWRIRQSELSETPSGELLHQAFRLLTIQAAIHQTKVEKVFRCFRAFEVEPILTKGWSVARRYPQPGLRPYGDIDLLIKPHDRLAASRIIASDDLRDCRIDLHPGPFELTDRSIAGVFARSSLVQCDAQQVRILSDEDHLALLAVHFLKHAGWRPLWLCDVGLLLESISREFDWDVCLGTDRRRANWILIVIGLARELLGASVNDQQIAARATVPAWVMENVLTNWEQPFVDKHEPHNHHAPIQSYLREPRGFFSDLKRRWPSPILATITSNGTFGNRRRLRYQLKNCAQRAARLVRPLPAPQ